MTHFNHEWDTAKTPVVPVSVGDRYYAQDLNDDFNYLKHLPYEIFLQGRSRGVMITPNDTWDNDTNSLTLSGGIGTVLQDCIELDPNEDFVIPPKTHSSPRYERIPFIDTVLVLPNDGAMHYIVATPTKRSLLQRTKALFAEQYASRVQYDGIITIQNTAPTAGQILVGLCHDKEYCLLIDINPDQCKDNIILKKWFGQSKITHDFLTALQSYYNTSITSIETNILINTIYENNGIDNGTFNNCAINIHTMKSHHGIDNGTFNNCAINIGMLDGHSVHGIHSGNFRNCDIIINLIKSPVAFGITGGTFNDCTVSIYTINDSNVGIFDGTFNNCAINIGMLDGYGAHGIHSGNYNNCDIIINLIKSSVAFGITGGTFNNCTIIIGTINDSNVGIDDGTFNNCAINIHTISGGMTSTYGIGSGTYNNCNILIGAVIYEVDGITTAIKNHESVTLRHTSITCSAVTNLDNTTGKLNILNDAVLHAS